jgi:cold shock CspA family protein
MRVRGTLKKWNDERGFGFLETDETRAEIFVHVKSFVSRAGRPQIGDTFFFDIVPGPAGKRRATKVEPVKAVRARTNAQRKSSRRSASAALLALPGFVIVYAVAVHLWQPPRWMALVYLIASVVTFLVYALDKSAARGGRWRVEEATLHAARCAARTDIPAAQVGQDRVSLRVLGDCGGERGRVRGAVPLAGAAMTGRA